MSELEPPPPTNRNRLTLQFTIRFALLALGPLAIALTIAYYDARSALAIELEEKLRGVAARQALLLTETLRSRIDDAQVLAASQVAQRTIDDPRQVDAFQSFAQVYADTRHVGRVYLVNRQGSIVASAGSGPETTGSLRSPQLLGSAMTRVFERAITVLEAEVSDYLIHPATSRPAAFVAAPVLDQGKLLGALVLQLDSGAELGARSDFTGLGRTGETLIVTAHDRPGELTVVAPTRFDSSSAFQLRHGDNTTMKPLWSAAQGGRGYGTFLDYRNTEVFAVWRYVPSLRWGLVVKMDTREAFFPVRRLAQSFLIIFAVTSGLVMAAVVATSRMVVTPIRRLRDAASQLVNSALRGTKVELPSPNNEIGDLSQSLGSMAKQLTEAFEKLELANVTLEAKVEQRTDELSAKNRELETTLEQLRSAQERMVAQARMASLGQISKGVAHEIKNPLNFVNNFATLSKELCHELREVIHESPNVPEPLTTEADSLLEMMQDNLQRIESHGKRADLIVSGMLEHSRASSSTEARETDLQHAIHTSLEVAARSTSGLTPAQDDSSAQIPVDHLVSLRLDPDAVTLTAYPGDLCRALINILSNALWAVTRPNHTPQWDPPILVSTRRQGDDILIEIRDYGVGMDPTTLKNAIHPFFTTKPPGEGTGLGLSLAYEIIVQLHKGHMDMTSEPGQGTTVLLTLPAAVPVL